MRILFSYSVKLIVFLLIISSCSTDHATKTDEQLEHEMVLKHRIKNITDYKTDIQFGVEQKEQISHIRNFDENGWKQKETTYSDGTITSSITFEYDKNGNLLTINAIEPDSSVLFKVTMNYYENNLRKEYYFYLPDGTYKYRNFATYDKSGKMTELKYYWPDGLKAINKYKYDGNKKTEDTEYAPDGKFRYKWIYNYDKNDNLIEAIQYYPGNKINGKIIYEYDLNNQLVKQTIYFEESVTNIFTFTYNEKKILSSKTTLTSFGRLSEKIRYAYEFY